MERVGSWIANRFGLAHANQEPMAHGTEFGEYPHPAISTLSPKFLSSILLGLMTLAPIKSTKI